MMRYYNTRNRYNTSRCGGTVYALVSKTSPERVEGSNLSIGITPPWLSTIVFHALHRPIEILPESTEIQGRLPVLLSVLGSPAKSVPVSLLLATDTCRQWRAMGSVRSTFPRPIFPARL